MRDSQIEVGTVGQNREVRAFCPGRSHQLPEFPIDSRYVVDNFDQTDHGETARIHHLPHTRIA
jgi:hypothetical protein